MQTSENRKKLEKEISVVGLEMLPGKPSLQFPLSHRKLTESCLDCQHKFTPLNVRNADSGNCKPEFLDLLTKSFDPWTEKLFGPDQPNPGTWFKDENIVFFVPHRLHCHLFSLYSQLRSIWTPVAAVGQTRGLNIRVYIRKAWRGEKLTVHLPLCEPFPTYTISNMFTICSQHQ